MAGSSNLIFLFTDIEGSTSLWERFPDAMRAGLARHDELLRVAIHSNGGTVFKTVGDAFHAVFPTAAGALAAALESQRALHRQSWAGIPAIRVRMAINTGTAEERDGDFFGPALNRVARLLNAGHGGQILLTLPARDGLAGLPAATDLRDMGERRLKDLSRPERIFQVVAEDLPSDFPPLNTLEAVPNNLPAALTSFIGREREISEVKRLLESRHLMTLTGAGGCGKTRLSLQVAADLLDVYSGGVWFVELAPLTDPSTVPQAVANAIGIREEPSASLPVTLADGLRNKTSLLVLDNCEHLIDACAELTMSLLRACPNLRIIASSREALGIDGETVWRVPSLANNGGNSEAIRLFCDRAVAILPEFMLTASDEAHVLQICQRLDGIPLAIELAAARVNVLSVEQIAERLNDRFRLLTGGSRTALPRQRTLRAAIDWSYDLLSHTERKVLHRISVFTGGFTLEAAEKISADDTLCGDDILDLLSRLVEKSLIQVEQHGREPRYNLLEMIRQYSRDRLLESGDAALMGSRHRDYFAQFVERAEPELVGPNQAEWLNRLEVELENLRAALTWSISEEAGVQTALKMSAILFRFWFIRGYFTEGRQWLSEIISKAGSMRRTPEWARALRAAATLALNQGDYVTARQFVEEATAIFSDLQDRGAVSACSHALANVAYAQGDFSAAQKHAEESLSGYRTLGNDRGIAGALCTLGTIIQSQGDNVSAKTKFEESLELYRRMGHKEGIALVLGNLGTAESNLENYERSQALHEGSLEIYRALGSKQNIALALINLGDIALIREHYEQAGTLFEESLGTFTALGDKRGIAASRHNLGLAAQSLGDLPTARACLQDALKTRIELREAENVAYSLEALARLALAEEKLGRAALAYAAAANIRERTGARLPPRDQKAHEASIAELKRNLDSTVFAREWETGRRLTIGELPDYLLA